MGSKRLISILLQKALEKAEKENWSRDIGSGFTEEQIIRVQSPFVIIDDYGDGIGHKYAIQDLNRRELEIVRDWILAGNKMRRK